MRKIDKKGEAAFYVLVFLAVLIISFLYWKIILVLGVIAATLFFFFHSNKSVSDPLYQTKSLRADKQSTFKEKGEVFEAFIADHFRGLDYDVIERGKLYGKKDKGIDLIATNENETLLIQCKNWSAGGRYSITHSHIKEFIGNTFVFLEGGEFSDQRIRRLFVVSENVFDRSAINYIRDNSDIVEYRVIPMPY